MCRRLLLPGLGPLISADYAAYLNSIVRKEFLLPSRLRIEVLWVSLPSVYRLEGIELTKH